jgi:putative thioredoxin
VQARFDRALALYGMDRREEAIDELLAILKKNREWNDQAARKQLVQFFEAQGPKDPLTLSGRRKLSSILFS